MKPVWLTASACLGLISLSFLWKGVVMYTHGNNHWIDWIAITLWISSAISICVSIYFLSRAVIMIRKENENMKLWERP